MDRAAKKVGFGLLVEVTWDLGVFYFKDKGPLHPPPSKIHILYLRKTSLSLSLSLPHGSNIGLVFCHTTLSVGVDFRARYPA